MSRIARIDYVIPGNDDAIRAIRLYVTAVADAIQEGKEAAAGEVHPDEFVEVVEEAEPAKVKVTQKPAPPKKSAAIAAPEAARAAEEKAAETLAEETPDEVTASDEATAVDSSAEKAPAAETDVDKADAEQASEPDSG